MNMNFLIILLSVFLLSACTEQNTEEKKLIFSGESDNWSVSYEADVITETTENSETTGYTIQYIGNGPIPERIEYSIFRSSGSTTLDQNGAYKTYGSSCSNCAVTSEDSEMEATIKWWNSSETIPLVLE